jgi:hypothetical protein
MSASSTCSSISSVDRSATSNSAWLTATTSPGSTSRRRTWPVMGDATSRSSTSLASESTWVASWSRAAASSSRAERRPCLAASVWASSVTALRRGGVDGLLGHRAAGAQALGPAELEAGELELGLERPGLRGQGGQLRRAGAGLALGAGELGLALGERVGPERVVDAGQDLAGGHRVPLLGQDGLDVVADAGLDDDAVDRLDRAGGVDRLDHPAASDRLGGDRGRALPPPQAGADGGDAHAGDDEPATQMTWSGHTRGESKFRTRPRWPVLAALAVGRRKDGTGWRSLCARARARAAGGGRLE